MTPEEKRRFLAQRAQETEQRRALFNAEADAEGTYGWPHIYFMNSFHFREGGGSKLPALYTLPIYDFDLRATHARTLLPAALASVSSGFVLVRVRVRSAELLLLIIITHNYGDRLC